MCALGTPEPQGSCPCRARGIRQPSVACWAGVPRYKLMELFLQITSKGLEISNEHCTLLDGSVRPTLLYSFYHSQVALKKKSSFKKFRVDLQCCILFYILFYYGLFRWLFGTLFGNDLRSIYVSCEKLSVSRYYSPAAVLLLLLVFVANFNCIYQKLDKI